MRTLKSILLAGAMLLATPAFFSSCQEDAPQIDYTMSVTVVNDFTKVVDAINNGTLKNEQAIAQLTAAIDKMSVDQQTKLQAIKDVLNSLNATVDAKLAAIEAAMKAQTIALEGKLALIEDAMKAQTLALEKKCDALVAAIKALPDYTEKLQAIEKAISALPDYTSKLEAIEKALTSQTLELKDKLAAIEATMKNQSIMLNDRLMALENAIKALPDYTDKLQAIEKAISALPDYTDKLAAIDKALASQTMELSDRLVFIEAAMKEQTLKLADKLEALEKAIKALPDYTDKLAAIEAAIKALPNYEAQLKALNNLITDQNSKLDDQIAALEGIMNAIPDISNKLDAIENAIKAMPDYDAAINGIKDEIANLVKEVKTGNKSEADALAEIAKKLEELKAAGGSTTVVKDCVDLGLPSGLMWRKYNVGANSEYEKGNYYAWGETVTKQDYYFPTYKWGEYIENGYKSHYTKYNETDKLTLLQPEDDAATANLGNNYRTPTVKEWEELLAECTWEVATTTNKNNKTVIDYWKVVGPNGNFIILPSAGYYFGEEWKSYASCYQSASEKAILWEIDETNEMPNMFDVKREYGYPVRPVYTKK